MIAPDSVWKKSSYSDAHGGNCVEVASAVKTHVRDSKVHNSPHLEFPAAHWAVFLSASSR